MKRNPPSFDKERHLKQLNSNPVGLISCRSYFDRKRFLKQLKKRRHIFLSDNLCNPVVRFGMKMYFLFKVLDNVGCY